MKGTAVERHLESVGGGLAVETGEEYLVRPLRDRARIREMLESRRAYAAYALGQLEPRLFVASQWWLAEGPRGQALLVHARGGLGHALLALGDAPALDALLRLHPGPRQTFATCLAEHLPVMVHYFYLSQQQPMIRMQVAAETFRPPTRPSVRLHGRDARTINRLYSSEGANSSYTASQVEEGIYHGIYVDGRLAAVAGTHGVSASYGVAVVGNVYTHPHYRGRGLGGTVTGAVTAEALERCPLVVLSVDPRNRAAVRAYQRLGYREECRLIEAAATRRDLVGLAPVLRRLVAGLRGRRQGGALVRLSGEP